MSNQEDTEDLGAALARALETEEPAATVEPSGLEQSLDSTGSWERLGTGSWNKQESEKPEFDDLNIDFSDDLAEEPVSAIESGGTKATKKTVETARAKEAKAPKPKPKAKPKPKPKANPKPKKREAQPAPAAAAGLSLGLEDDNPEPAVTAKPEAKKSKRKKDVAEVAAPAAEEEEVDLSAAFGGKGVTKKVKKSKSSLQPGKQAATAPAASAQDAKATESTKQEPDCEFEDKIVIYDLEEKKEELRKLILFSLGGSVIGAMAWALFIFFSLGFGGRISLLALSFFAAFGARLGADQVRGRKVRLVAGLSAAFSAILAKFFLVILLTITFTKFTQEDLIELTDQRAAQEQYSDQQLESYQELLDTGDGDYEDGESYAEDDEYYDDGEYDADAVDLEALKENAKSSTLALGFFQIFFSLFTIFDLPFIIIAAIVASRLAVDSS